MSTISENQTKELKAKYGSVADSYGRNPTIMKALAETLSKSVVSVSELGEDKATINVLVAEKLRDSRDWIGCGECGLKPAGPLISEGEEFTCQNFKHPGMETTGIPVHIVSYLAGDTDNSVVLIWNSVNAPKVDIVGKEIKVFGKKKKPYVNPDGKTYKYSEFPTFSVYSYELIKSPADGNSSITSSPTMSESEAKAATLPPPSTPVSTDQLRGQVRTFFLLKSSHGPPKKVDFDEWAKKRGTTADALLEKYSDMLASSTDGTIHMTG